MKKFSLTWTFVTLVIVAPVTVFGLVKWYENKYEKLPVLGPQGHTAGDFKMLDQSGKLYTERENIGKIVVTDFFFTHCPSICPKMTKSLKNVQQVFINDDDVVINSFSVDPLHDSAERLAFYASQFDIKGQWHLLTGDKKDIYRLARKAFFVDATDGDGGPNDFIHSDKLILTDTKGRIRGYYNGTDKTEVDQLITDISKLKKESN